MRTKLGLPGRASARAPAPGEALPTKRGYWAVLVVALACAAGLPGMPGIGCGRAVADDSTPAKADQARRLFIFLIDHSSSMLNNQHGMQATDPKDSRWAFVADHAVQWAETLEPARDDVRVCVFNQDVPGKRDGGWLFRFEPWRTADSGRFAGELQKVGVPVPNGEGTALWNALGWAMREVQRDDRMYDESWILLYSDGEDQSSKPDPSNPDWTFDTKNPDSREQVKRRWLSLLDRVPQAHLYVQLLGGMQPDDAPIRPESLPNGVRHVYVTRPAPRRPEVVLSLRPHRAARSYLEPGNALDVEFDVSLTGPGAAMLRGRFARVTFHPSGAELGPGGDLPEEHPEAGFDGTVPLQSGRHAVRFTRREGKKGTALSGKVFVTWDAPDGVEVRGTRYHDLRFAEAGKVTLEVLSPRKGDGVVRVARGQPVAFEVKHDGDGPAKWNFDDDASSEEGDRVSHVFKATSAGCRVSVQAGGAGQMPASRDLMVQVVDAAAQVEHEDPAMAARPVKKGQEVRLCARLVGDGVGATRFEWALGDSASPKSTLPGESLAHRFESLGAQDVVVTAITDVGEIKSPPLRLQVVPGEEFGNILYPSPLNPGTQADFVAHVNAALPGDVVRWDLLDAETLRVLPGVTGTSPIVNGKAQLQPTLPRDLPPRVILRATLVRSEDGRAAQDLLVRKLSVGVNPLVLKVTNFEPKSSARLVIGDPLDLAVTIAGPDAAGQAMRWRVTWPGAATAEERKETRSRPGVGERESGLSLLREDWPARPGPVLVEMVAPDLREPVRWNLEMVLPDLPYKVRAPGIQTRRLAFPAVAEASIEPEKYIKSVQWTLRRSAAGGGTPSVQEALKFQIRPGLAEVGEHTLQALVTRVDGRRLTLPAMTFEHVAPVFRIVPPAGQPLWLGRDATLAIHPEQEAKDLVEAVEWSGDGAPGGRDVSTSVRPQRVGPFEVGALLKLKDGRGAVQIDPLRAQVTASGRIDAEPAVERDGDQRVNLFAHVRAGDYTSLFVEVEREGQAPQRIEMVGGHAPYAFEPAAYGTYAFKFQAERQPTPDNPQAVQHLGTQVYAHAKKQVLLFWVGLVAVILAVFIVLYGFVINQHPRNWIIRVDTAMPAYGDDGQPSFLHGPETRWRRFGGSLQKILVSDVVKALTGEDATAEAFAKGHDFVLVSAKTSDAAFTGLKCPPGGAPISHDEPHPTIRPPIVQIMVPEQAKRDYQGPPEGAPKDLFIWIDPGSHNRHGPQRARLWVESILVVGCAVCLALWWATKCNVGFWS